MTERLQVVFFLYTILVHAWRTALVLAVYNYKCQVISPSRNDVTLVKAYPLVSLADKVFPRHTHHLGEVKDRYSAFWVG